jgi:hypothetical protein
VTWTVTDMFCHGDLDVDGEREIRLMKWELSILLQAAEEVEKSRGEEQEINRLRWQLEALLDAIGEMGIQEVVMRVSRGFHDEEGKRTEAAE